MSYEPPFRLSERILQLVADIAQKVGRVEILGEFNTSTQLRKENRIRTIQSSLAIENNSLSLEQVTALVDDKRVLAPPKDILEVQNAIRAYDALPTFDAMSLEDLLEAHRLLMSGLTSEAGRFRSGNVGVFSGDQLIHAGTPAHYVPEIMDDLFSWLRRSEVHPLVASCVFHYEFEFIHPFADGNGRMGRLWQTLILSDWNSLFAWLPVESVVKDRQEGYYRVLQQADNAADSTPFVVFMLEALSDALGEIAVQENDVGINDGINVGINDGAANAASQVQEKLLALVKANPTITAARLSEQLSLSKRQVERLMAALKAEGRLVRIGANRNGRWEVR